MMKKNYQIKKVDQRILLVKIKYINNDYMIF